METALVDLAVQSNLTLQWIPAHCGIQANELADRLAREGGQLEQEDRYTSYTDETTIIKTLSKKNGSCSTQTITNQTPTNWIGQSRLFCSGWELDTTDLMPTCTRSSRLASLRCAHARQTSWLQNIYCSTVDYSTVDYMMLGCGTCGLNRRYWGTSSMATRRSWGGQPPSWGQQASPSNVRRRRRISNVSLPICGICGYEWTQEMEDWREEI